MAKEKITNNLLFALEVQRCIFIETTDKEFYTYRYTRGSYSIFFPKVWAFNLKLNMKLKPMQVSIDHLETMKKH